MKDEYFAVDSSPSVRPDGYIILFNIFQFTVLLTICPIANFLAKFCENAVKY